MAGAAQLQIPLNNPFSDSENARRYLENLMKKPVIPNDEENIKQRETAIVELGKQLAKELKADDLRQMIRDTRECLIPLGKAKAAKVIRLLMDLYLDIDPPTPADTRDHSIKVELCKECIQWALDHKRVFLRQTLEARLVRLYNDIEKSPEALNLIARLVKELKKLDDKELMVEVQLEESKAFHRMGNATKARAALTSARTTANGIYVPPKMQAALDLQSGILHAADDRDFKTAYSYFYEAFEGYDSIENPESLRALKYMLLCKIMLNVPEDINGILSGKIGLKYVGPDIEALKAVAGAAKKRSLAEFNEAFGKYVNELQKDQVIKSHFQTLWDSMLEKNLCRDIEPYSRVEIDHAAKNINLPKVQIEKKLSQMILDKKIKGILDQGKGVLVIFNDLAVDNTYDTALQTVHALSDVVDGLFRMSKKLS